jgi:hypothetical protein
MDRYFSFRRNAEIPWTRRPWKKAAEDLGGFFLALLPGRSGDNAGFRLANHDIRI